MVYEDLWEDDKSMWFMACAATIFGFLVTILALIGLWFLVINAGQYTSRSTQNGVTCIVRHSELTNTVLGVDCPRPFTNSQSN